MRYRELQIGSLVSNCTTWNPKKEECGTFDYIDLSSIDKDHKCITKTYRYMSSEAPSRARQIVEAGDVLVATVRPNLNGVALVSQNYNGMTASTGFCVLRPIPEILDSNYLFHWVKTGMFVRGMVNCATGASYPAVSDAKVKASKIPLPTLPEQKRIAAILDAAEALRTKRREAIALLDDLVQSVFLDMFGDPVTNPKEWDTACLRELVETNPRLNRSAIFDEDEVSFVPMASVSDISKRVTSYKVRKYKEVAKGYTCFRRGDVLVAKITPCFENGKMALTADMPHSVGFGSTEFHVFRPSRSILGQYLFYLLQQSYFINHGAKKMRGAAGQRRVPIEFFEQFKVPIPPLETQHRFAAVVQITQKQGEAFYAHLVELDNLFTSLQQRAFKGEL